MATRFSENINQLLTLVFEISLPYFLSCGTISVSYIILCSTEDTIIHQFKSLFQNNLFLSPRFCVYVNSFFYEFYKFAFQVNDTVFNFLYCRTCFSLLLSFVFKLFSLESGGFIFSTAANTSSFILQIVLKN